MLPELSREERLGVALTVVGGIHYGYNLAIAGVIARAVAAALDADPSIEQVLLGIALLGAVVGSPLSGWVAERSGRVQATLLGESLSLVGALVGAVSFSTTTLTTSRFIVGLGIGICTMCKPLYVSETVSAERRGTVLALFAPAIAVGILLAQSWPAFLLLFVDERPPLDGEVLPSYHYDDAHVPGRPSAGWVWRVQLLTGTIPPGIILAIALLAMPESPVFLKAQAARASVRASASASPGRPGPPSSRNAASAVSDVSSLLPAVPDGALGLISTPGAGRAAAFAVMLGVTQQGTGVVAVVLFGTTLLSSAADAFGGKLETWMALVVPAANLGGAIAGAALIDVIGRRKAYISGLSAMMVTMLIPLALLAAHATTSHAPRDDAPAPPVPPTPSSEQTPVEAPMPPAGGSGQPLMIASLVCMALWAIAFELGPGCGYFVVLTEITSPELRPFAVSLGNMCRYLIELLLMFTFLSMWHATPPSPVFVLAAFALVCAACLAFFCSQLLEVRNSDGTYNLSPNWKAARGVDIESLRSDHAGHQTQFPPDAPPPRTPVPRALKRLAAATSSARDSAVESFRSFSFGSIPSFSAAVAHYSPFASPLAFPEPELPLPSPLTVQVTSAAEVPSSDGPSFRSSSPAFLSPGRTAKSYMAYTIEARAPGARRAHTCTQRFSSFDFYLADLTKAGALSVGSVGSSAVRLSPAARACIDGWRRRLLLEKMAAAGDRSRDPSVVSGRVALLRRMMQEVLAFDEVAEADVTYAFVFGPGWREGDPTASL